jgi:hypothetical protein
MHAGTRSVGKATGYAVLWIELYVRYLWSGTHAPSQVSIPTLPAVEVLVRCAARPFHEMYRGVVEKADQVMRFVVLIQTLIGEYGLAILRRQHFPGLTLLFLGNSVDFGPKCQTRWC